MYHGERFNAWTHLVGAVLALVGMIWLLVVASLDGDPHKIIASAIYGVTLLLLYGISTIYHSLRGRAKTILRKFDHLSIYLLIAGSYTPFCLVTLPEPWGRSLLTIIWTLALFGMLQEFKQQSEARVLSLVIYAVMGWLILVAVKPLLAALGSEGFSWLVAGGVFYTVGIVFFAFDSRFRHWHGIWHLFVMVGSLLHFVTIFFYVV